MLPYIIEVFSLNEDNFKILFSFYGKKTLLLLQNDKFLNVVSRDKEDIIKFIDLMKIRAIDQNIISAINDSLRQNIFAIEHKDIIEIYSKIMKKIQNGLSYNDKLNIDKDLLPSIMDLNLEKELTNYINSQNITIKEKQQQINDLDKDLLYLFNQNKVLFLHALFKLLKINQYKYTMYLHVITNKYIIDKRNECAKESDIFKDTNIRYRLDNKSLYDNLFNYLLKNDFKSLFNFINNKNELDIKTLNYLNNPTNINKEELLQIKKNIFHVKELFVYSLEYSTRYSRSIIPSQFQYILEKKEFIDKVKKELIIDERKVDIIEDFSNLNTYVLFDNVINNNKKYQALIDIINKYRILEWRDLFEPSLNKLTIESSNIYAFINGFDKIYDLEMKHIVLKLKEKMSVMKKEGYSIDEILNYYENNLKLNINPYKIMKYCTIYSNSANCYKLILGLEDFELVKANPPENSSHGATEEEILKRATEVYLQMFFNQYVVIPSYIKKYITSSNKNIIGIIGNKSATFNSSHGERTSACMRALGQADELYEFCNASSNGFHITLLSEKGEYISRVSGFRNGNTVFLNQLRFSVCENYSNDDLKDVLEKIAKDLIEMSKNNEMTIENVVISPTYVYNNCKTQVLSVYDIGDGVYSGYKDISNIAVIIATKNNEAIPVELGKDMPIYKAVRMPVIKLDNPMNDFNEHIKIQRITVLKECLNHKEHPLYYQGCDIDINELENEYLKIYLGQDWYITLDKDYNIKYDFIPTCDEAEREMNEALKEIEDFKNNLLNGRRI